MNVITLSSLGASYTSVSSGNVMVIFIRNITMKVDM